MSAEPAPVRHGPPIAALVNRLASCPEDFLAQPLVGGRGTVAVAAVVGDTLRGLDAELSDDWVAAFSVSAADDTRRNWLRACLITCWLVTDPELQRSLTGEVVLRFLAHDLLRTVSIVPAPHFVADVDRREELARLLLQAADLVPAGESPEQAADRLSTIDSVNRSRVEAEARAAEERARAVRAALERKRAEEAAARASRE